MTRRTSGARSTGSQVVAFIAGQTRSISERAGTSCSCSSQVSPARSVTKRVAVSRRRVSISAELCDAINHTGPPESDIFVVYFAHSLCWVDREVGSIAVAEELAVLEVRIVVVVGFHIAVLFAPVVVGRSGRKFFHNPWSP